ncbi:MAG: hypothetical protein QGF59_26215 [Pirellulaceae bacterium]|jgi:hypothetical protein|nr:hypothetical protein [Pirellulaceae bacterium]
MLYLGRRLIPLLLLGFYFIVDEDEPEGAGAIHLIVFVIACVAVTWGEHWALQTYVFKPQ